MKSMLIRPALILALAIAVLSAIAPSLANADPRAEPTNPEARAHFELGNKLFFLKEFEKAISEYKSGALIESLPVWDLALGQCYRMLHRYEDSLWHLERFIKYGHPSGGLLKGINEVIAPMRAEVEKNAMSQRSAGGPPGQTAPAAAAPTPVIKIENTSPWYRDGLGLALVGVGTIGVAAGGYLLLDGSRLHDEANRDPSQARQDALNDQANSRVDLGAGLGIAGIVALSVGVIRFATRPSDRSTRATVAWTITASTRGIAALGRF